MLRASGYANLQRMRQATLVFLMCFVIGAPAALAAQAPTCPPYTSPIVLDFKTQMPPATYNRNLNVAGIRNLFSNRGQAAGGPHSRALGITAVETILSLRAASRLVPRQNGYCVYLTSVDADFGWQRLQVFIASELKSGSCGYSAVLDHENQHVAINRETATQFAPRVRARLEELLKAQKPVFVRDTGPATDAILDQIKNRSAPVVNDFAEMLAARQAVIDTAKNYSATSALCADWGDTQQ